MIDIKISVSNVDYEAALDTLLPVLLEHLSKKNRKCFFVFYLIEDKRGLLNSGKSSAEDASAGYKG